MLNIIKVDMKRTVTRIIPSLKINLVYKIGSNAKNNFELIDESDPNDMWFHLHNESSCHVIACLKNIQYTTRDDELPNFYDINFDDLDKKEKHQIITQGALLCKQYSKLKSAKNVPIIYTKIEDVQKTNVVGSVLTKNTKTVVV
jgi:predicted ribosome quality control (RQC) complex YloA/Tae2 family protein